MTMFEEINRHIEELIGRLPTNTRDRLLEDAMAVRALLVREEMMKSEIARQTAAFQP